MSAGRIVVVDDEPQMRRVLHTLSSPRVTDPHLSPASVEAQIARVARARGANPDRLRPLVSQFTEGRDLGFLGEPRVCSTSATLCHDEEEVQSSSFSLFSNN